MINVFSYLFVVWQKCGGWKGDANAQITLMSHTYIHQTCNTRQHIVVVCCLFCLRVIEALFAHWLTLFLMTLFRLFSDKDFCEIYKGDKGAIVNVSSTNAYKHTCSLKNHVTHNLHGCDKRLIETCWSYAWCRSLIGFIWVHQLQPKRLWCGTVAWVQVRGHWPRKGQANSSFRRLNMLYRVECVYGNTRC